MNNLMQVKHENHELKKEPQKAPASTKQESEGVEVDWGAVEEWCTHHGI